MLPFFALLLAATSVDSASLADDGLRAYEEMDLDGARDLLSRAQRAAPPRERPRVEMWLGIVELERGNEAVARRWLRSALQVNPSLAVPPSVSPKVRALVDELRPTARAAAPTRVARRARSPLELAARAESPPAAADPTSAPALDATQSPHGPTIPDGAPPAPAAVAPGGLALPSPLVLAGAGAGAVAVGALGGGVILGALAQGAADEAQREVRAVDASARYDQASATAWFANGLYALSAVAAAVGVGCATVELAGVGE